MALADVDLTVAARDETGQTLSNIDSRLVDMNKTLEKQVAIFERSEKQYTEFIDRIEMSAPTIKTVFDNMHTQLTKINKALRSNEKAQRNVNNETAKASKSGGGGQGGTVDSELYKKTTGIDIEERNEKQKQANRAALVEEGLYQNSLLEKQREGTKQYLSELEKGNTEKGMEARETNDRRLRDHQKTLDEEYQGQKSGQDKELSLLVSGEKLKGNQIVHNMKQNLKITKAETKNKMEVIKGHHDKILKQRKEHEKEQSAIRNQAIGDEMKEAKDAYAKAESEGTAHTDKLIRDRTVFYEKELSENKSFRGKSLATLESQQQKEIAGIDESDSLRIILTKYRHVREMGELVEHLNQKDSVLEDEYDKELLRYKATGERLLNVDKEILGERISSIKEQHEIIESEAKVHESKMTQIRKHSRRTDLSKAEHEGTMKEEKALQEIRKQQQKIKDSEREQIRRAKTGAQTTTERSDIDLQETLSKQKLLHEQQLSQEKRFTDEMVQYFKRGSKEATAVIEAESKAQAQIRKQSAKEQSDIAKKQSDRIANELKKSQEDELESLKQIGGKKLTRRETRHKVEMDALLDERSKIRNVTEDSLDDDIAKHKEAANKKEAILEMSARNAITERQKQSRNEIRALTQRENKRIEIVKASLAELEIQHARDKREALLDLKVQHEKEIGLIDIHEKIKLAQKEEAQSKEIADRNSHFDKLYATDRNELEKQLSLLEGHLRVKTSEKEAALDKDVANLKAYGDKVESIEESQNIDSLAELESYKRKRLSEIDHMAKMEEERLRQKQRKLSRIISDEVKESSVGRFLGKANRVISGFLAADFATIGVRELWGWVKGLGAALVTMEAMKLSLTAVEGSAEKAYMQLDRIAKIAKLPGVHLESAIKTTVTLRALKLEAGLVERTIIAIGNALATLGRESELGGVTLALSQIIGKGKVHAEEINQIAERLPLIRGVLVEQFGTANTEILQKMDIKINDFIARITEGLENLPKVATTIGTELKNMKNQWFLFKASLGTLLKPAMMTAIRAWTNVLDGANVILKALNKGGKDSTIMRDKTIRTIEHVENYLTAMGKNEVLNKHLSDLTAKLDEHRETLKELERGDQSSPHLRSSIMALETMIKQIKLTEGGYNPNEPAHVGGESFAGITKDTYNEWAKGPVIKSMKELAKYPDVVMQFYREYLSNVQELPDFLQYTYADFFTNARGNAVKIIQEMVGATVDGTWGPQTKSAVHKWKREIELALLTDSEVDDRIIRKFHEGRMAHYESIKTKNPELYAENIQGWRKRDANVLASLDSYFDNDAQDAVSKDTKLTGDPKLSMDLYDLSTNIRATMTGIESDQKEIAGCQ